MNKQEYTSQSIAILSQITPLLNELHRVTQEFKTTNPDTNMNSLPSNHLDNEIDNTIVSLAVVKDTINDYKPENKKSLRFKVRKALGFTYP